VDGEVRREAEEGQGAEVQRRRSEQANRRKGRGAHVPKEHLSMQTAFETFVDPPREFGIIPFWFWNDDLEEAELIRQLREFHVAGFGGVMPHARIGLSHRVGYLTDEYFRLVRAVVEEVILYDEGSYPSGSANGAVVAENAEYASQSIRMWERDVEGPYSGFWRPNTGRALLDKHVCTVIGQVGPDDVIDTASLKVLEPRENTIFKIEVPVGNWKVMSVWNTASGGVIRGAFPESEDAHATAPPAGDILNPEAVACFLRLTHDRYYETLKEFFGNTVIAIFTDEPNVTGRGASRRRGRPAVPFTPGFVDYLKSLWGEDPTSWLPAMWVDYGEGTDTFRNEYAEAVQTRLQEVFYGGQSAWCADHGIDLTGHPAESNELTALRLFQLPGQDMVWRYVEPNKPSALEGEHSVAAKAATSGARLSNRRRILTEVCGAYGWNLTLDEVKWLFDWHIVRGNNLINGHATFYSIRDRRTWESEPDLAIHNVWWPYFKSIATYTRRLCWLLSDGEQVCDVAILGDGNDLPWQAAKQLYQSQIEFLYLDDQAVTEATIEGGHLRVGAQSYSVVIVEDLPVLSTEAREKLEAFRSAGGSVVEYSSDTSLIAELDPLVASDLRILPANPDLRFIHYKKQGLDTYLLVNEGEAAIDGSLELAVSGRVEAWDALSGKRQDMAVGPADGGVSVDLHIGRRESLVVVVDVSGTVAGAEIGSSGEVDRVSIDCAWEIFDDADKEVSVSAPGDWSKEDGWELFSGTLRYTAQVDFPDAENISLDLGEVGDIAEVLIDGVIAGIRMWAPYVVELEEVSAGSHTVEVKVTNSMVNAFEGKQSPSGMMGPVTLITKHWK
jgi:hypothetical protein